PKVAGVEPSVLTTLDPPEETAAVTHLTAARKFFAKLVTRQEEGATLAEYGLLLALIAVVCIAAITALGTRISSMCQTLATAICPPPGGAGLRLRFGRLCSGGRFDEAPDRRLQVLRQARQQPGGGDVGG